MLDLKDKYPSLALLFGYYFDDDYYIELITYYLDNKNAKNDMSKDECLKLDLYDDIGEDTIDYIYDNSDSDERCKRIVDELPSLFRYQ